MSRAYFLVHAEDGNGTSEIHLPVRVGGKDCGGIVIPGIADDVVLAMIAIEDGHAYIQPSETALAVFHNNENLTASAWLKSCVVFVSL